MKITQHKEDWINGGSEVHMVGFLSEEQPPLSGVGGSFQMQGAGNPHNFDGKRIDRIARRWINNLHQYDYVFHNYSIASNLNPFVSVMNYVIFEQDSWPASQHTHQFNYSNGKFLTIKYRSWQSPYHGNRLSRINNNNTGIPSANGYIGHTEGIYYIMQGF